MKLYNIVINNLKRRKSKMLFMLMGIVIGIATIVSVFNVVDSMQKKMTEQVSQFGANVVVSPDSGGLTFSYGGFTLPEILYDIQQLSNDDVEKMSQIQSRDMIRLIAPKLINVDVLENGQKVTVIGADLKQEFLIKPWLTVMSNDGLMDESILDKTQPALGQTEEKEMDYVEIDLRRQEIDRIELSEDEIIVGNALAKSLNVRQGDSVMLSGSEFRVKDILIENGEAEDNQIFMNLETAQNSYGKPDEITVIDLSVDYTAGSEDVLLAEIEESIPHAQVSSLRQENLRRDEMLGRLVRFGIAVSVLIVFIGMLVVGITMSGSVRERTREIGIFRALGFRKSHIIKILLSEAVIVCFFGGILGYVLGNALAGYAGPALTGEAMQTEWSLLILMMSIGVSVLIGLISGTLPALKAAKLDPAEALRFI